MSQLVFSSFIRTMIILVPQVKYVEVSPQLTIEAFAGMLADFKATFDAK